MKSNGAAISFELIEYGFSERDLDFFVAQTGIPVGYALDEHVLRVQAEASEYYPYSFDLLLAFLRLKASRWPAYNQLLQLGRERKGAIFLDIGCCIGGDLRKAAMDGFPTDNMIASDIEPYFWELGHKLFRTTPETFPARFIAGNALDESFLGTLPPFSSPPETKLPPLSALTTLTPLAGHVSAIHASAFFSLFGEAEQLHLACALAGLLSPLPGSVIFGAQAGRTRKGVSPCPDDRGVHMCCHSQVSWAELWDGRVFPRGTVAVSTKLVEADRRDLLPTEGHKFLVLVWSVTRL